jgi:hypothetical protein
LRKSRLWQESIWLVVGATIVSPSPNALFRQPGLLLDLTIKGTFSFRW